MNFASDFFIVVDSIVYNSTGLLFIVLGVFILIRISGFPDLTVDGSFTIGAALYSVCLVGNWGILPALIWAGVAGALGGLLTWTINVQLGVGKVVSGVLSMIILILVAPYISGSTKGLLNVISIYNEIDQIDASLTQAIIGNQPYQAHIIFSLIWWLIFVIVGTIVLRVLRTRKGLRLRYLGSAASPTLIPKSEQQWLLLFSLMGGNALVAIGGAIEAQRRGGYTNNMGIGILLVALASLILGESLIKSFRKRDYLTVKEYAVAVILGTVVYCIGVQAILALKIDFVDLRLLTALFLLLLLGIAGRVYSSSTRLF
jgi:putative ABC transport system permease protein